MTTNDRVYSIDILKGLSLTALLFFTDLVTPSAPDWITKLIPGGEIPELSNPAFYIFLFAFGMTIPFAIAKRRNNGMEDFDILKQILARTLVYLMIGILIINISRVEPALTGIGKNIWGILMIPALFLVWNRYSDADNKFFMVSGLRLAGLAILVFLVFRFRSGSLENSGSLISGWWGIIGLIGFGYLAASLTCLAVKNSIFLTFIIWVVFLSLHILSGMNLLAFFNPVMPYLGPIIKGYIPFIVISGLLASMLIKRFPDEKKGSLFYIFLVSGIILTTTGFLLIFKGVFDDFLLVYTGMSLILLSFIFYVTEIKGAIRCGSFLKPAWESSVTAYIILNFLYCLFGLTGLNILFYKGVTNPALSIAGSVIITTVALLITSLLNRLNVRLKI